MAAEVKKLGKAVTTPGKKSVTTFQQHLDDVTEILNNFQRTLDLFKDDQLDKLTELQTEVAYLPRQLEVHQKEQLKSYQLMITGIYESISQIQEEVENIEISAVVLLRSLKIKPDQIVSDAIKKDNRYGFDMESTMKKGLTLEERVLKYIDMHCTGIKISDMESPFGETRMRIGFVVKKLLDEEKIQKIENLYFPVK